MTTPRTPRPDPVMGQPTQRLRPSEERAILAAANRNTRRIAVAALVIGLLGFGFAAWKVAFPGSATCQGNAWDVSPKVGDLPAGWTVGASQYDVLHKQMTLLGPVPQDQSASQPVVLATITCFPDGAAQSVTRSRDAATAAGQVVTDRNDLGDQGFSATDDSGAVFLQLRHGDLVVYLATRGDATADDVDILASAFDLALGGDGGNIPIATVPPTEAPSGDTGASPSDQAAASESPAAPELEAALPTVVGDIQLTVNSATGATFLGDDQGSRAIVAALRAEGKQASDLRLAQAFDESGNSDLMLTALAVKGMSLDGLKQLTLHSWLAATGAGVKTETVTIGGKEATRVDYGDAGTMDYVLAEPGRVIIITTADPTVAAAAVAALP